MINGVSDMLQKCSICGCMKNIKQGDVCVRCAKEIKTKLKTSPKEWVIVMKLKLILQRYKINLNDVEYTVNVPCNIDEMSVQTPNGNVIPKHSEIWNEIYKIIDLR